MYEPGHARPLSTASYLRRLAGHAVVAACVLGFSLLGGVIGYRCFEGLGWRDAFLHAALLLSGIGLAEVPQQPGGKMFAGFYALYSGLVFLVVAGIVFAPVLHRLLHRFHWDEDTATRTSQRDRNGA